MWTPPHTELTSERYNKWIYFPNQQVYGLANLNEEARIYLLQSYSNLLNTAITVTTLPAGWIYFNVRLGAEEYLTSTAAGQATLVTDNFNNAYQYIDRGQAPNLYESLVAVID